MILRDALLLHLETLDRIEKPTLASSLWLIKAVELLMRAELERRPPEPR